MDRLLWTVQVLVSQGLYVVLDYQPMVKRVLCCCVVCCVFCVVRVFHALGRRAQIWMRHTHHRNPSTPQITQTLNPNQTQPKQQLN